jgi:hypothetical protein
MGKLAILSPLTTAFGHDPLSAQASSAGVEAGPAARRPPFSVAAKSPARSNGGLDHSHRFEPDSFPVPAADNNRNPEAGEHTLRIAFAGFVVFALAALGASFLFIAAAIRPH